MLEISIHAVREINDDFLIFVIKQYVKAKYLAKICVMIMYDNMKEYSKRGDNICGINQPTNQPTNDVTLHDESFWNRRTEKNDESGYFFGWFSCRPKFDHDYGVQLYIDMNDKLFLTFIIGNGNARRGEKEIKLENNIMKIISNYMKDHKNEKNKYDLLEFKKIDSKTMYCEIEISNEQDLINLITKFNDIVRPSDKNNEIVELVSEKISSLKNSKDFKT